MDQSNMKEALKRNRAKGIDLTIIVNGEDMSPDQDDDEEGSPMEEADETPDEEKAEELGLAPEATKMPGEGPLPLMQQSPDDDADPTQMIANSLRSSPMGSTPLGDRAMAGADKKFPPKAKKKV